MHDPRDNPAGAVLACPLSRTAAPGGEMDRIRGAAAAEAAQVVEQTLERAVVLARIALEHGNTARAKEHLARALHDLEPELALLCPHRRPARQRWRAVARVHACGLVLPLVAFAAQLLLLEEGTNWAFLPQLATIPLAFFACGWRAAAVAVPVSAILGAVVIAQSDLSHHLLPATAAYFVITALLVLALRRSLPSAPQRTPTPSPR